MKWWRRFLDRFKKTHCTVEFRTKPYWSSVVFNVPFRVVPACGDVIRIYREDWLVSDVDAYDDGTPRLTAVPI